MIGRISRNFYREQTIRELNPEPSFLTWRDERTYVDKRKKLFGCGSAKLVINTDGRRKNNNNNNLISSTVCEVFDGSAVSITSL